MRLDGFCLIKQSVIVFALLLCCCTGLYADLSSQLEPATTRLPEMWLPVDNASVWPDSAIDGAVMQQLSSPFDSNIIPSRLLEFIGPEALAEVNITDILNPQAIHAFSDLLALSHSTTKNTVSPDIVRHRNASQSHVQLRGLDTDIRPVAVTFQKAFEASLLQKLHNKQLQHCRIIVHTPRPATPLCNQPGQVLESSIHATMLDDEKRLKTVRDRTLTLRQLAKFGTGVELYVVYPKDGLDRRTKAEQAIYKAELENKQNVSLYDKPLDCASIPPYLCGASYFLELTNGQTLFFSLNGSQAADCDDAMLWEYWFDSITNPDVKVRYDQVVSFLKNHGLPLNAH